MNTFGGITKSGSVDLCTIYTHAHKTCAPDRPADRLTPTLWLTLRTRPAHRLALASANLPLAPHVSPCCHPCDSSTSFPSASHFPHLMVLFFVVSMVRLTNSITEIWKRAAEVRQCKKQVPEDDHTGFKQMPVGSDKLGLKRKWRGGGENLPRSVRRKHSPRLIVYETRWCSFQLVWLLVSCVTNNSTWVH